MSDEIEMAFACRALAPTIVLPVTAESWTDDRRRAVLMHELAHVKRHDLVGHVFGRLACALYWFHPLVWAAAKNLRAESERACDDLVLSCGTRPSEYAQHLLDMVTSVRRQGAPIMALPMARKKEFEGRMLAILDPAIRRASPGRLQSAVVVATVGVLSLTIAAVAPVAPVTPPPPPPAARQGVVTVPPADSPQVAPTTTMAMDMPSRREQAVAPRPAPAPLAAPAAAAAPTQPSDPATTAARALAGPLSAFVTSTVTGALSTLGAMSGAHQVPDSGRVTLLVHILSTDADASVRRTAAWGLQDAQRADARDALIKALRNDASASVRETAAWALADYTNAEVISALDAGLRDKSDKVRATSAWAIGTLGAENEVGALTGMLTDSDAEAKQLAIWALGQMKLRTAPPALTKALGDDSPQVREIAAWALGQIEDPSVAPAIISAFQAEQSSQARTAEMWALMSMGKMSQSVIDVALKSSDPELRRHAVSMLAGGSGGSGGAWPWPWPWPWPRPFPD